jgi:membrane protease YdiL (CAAX protease family)
MGSIMTGVAVALPALYVMWLLPLPAPTAEFTQMVATRKALVYLSPGAFFLKAVLIYPLIEEVFYRGLMFTLLRRYAPGWLAVLAPTSLFALTHAGSGLVNVGFAFIVGLYFCWLVVRSRSLLTSVLCHAAINLFLLFVFDPIMDTRGLVNRPDAFAPLPLAMLAGSLALLVYGVHILRAEFGRRQTPREARGASDVAVSAVA